MVAAATIASRRSAADIRVPRPAPDGRTSRVAVGGVRVMHVT
jgi:hypothetical protein